jgi:hypothetical protein
MTVHVDTQSAPRTALRSRREQRVAAQRDADPVERYHVPEAVNSQRAYGRSIYQASQVNVLLGRYVRIRGDLLMALPNVAHGDDPTKEQAAYVCSDMLREAKKALERRKVTLTVVAHLLSLADRALVSLYSDEVMRFRVHTLRSRLLQVQPVPRQHLRFLGQAVRGLREGTRDQVETAVKDVLSFLGELDERRWIEDDLQVSRLSKAIGYVAFGWVLLLVMVPFLASVQRGANGQVIWPVFDLAYADGFDLFLGALGLSFVGAVGGIVSGMFSVRDSTTNLLDYRTSVKRMTLKPLVGAVAALTLYFFLGANVISGVAVTSAGTYIVAAFLAGFSERYFLRFVERGSEEAAAAQSSETSRAVQRRPCQESQRAA